MAGDATNYIAWSEGDTSPIFPDVHFTKWNSILTHTQVEDSCMVFQILTDPKGRWTQWPGSDWHIVRQATTQLRLEHQPLLDVG